MAETVVTRTARKAVAEIDPAIASAETMMEVVSAKNQETLAPYVPEGSTMEYIVLLKTLVGLLEGCKARILAGDKHFRTVEGDKNRLGARVRGLTRTAESAARRVRTDVRRHYGEEVLESLMLTEPPEDKRFELLEQLKHIIEILKGFDRESHEPIESMSHLEVNDKVTYLEEKVANLDGGQKEYELAVKKTETERQALNRLIAEERRSTVNAIAMLEASYRMAGFDEEAKRLRFLIRRATRSKAQDDGGQDPAPPDAQPDTDGAAAEAPEPGLPDPPEPPLAA